MKASWTLFAVAGLLLGCTAPGANGPAKTAAPAVLKVNEMTLSQDGFAVYAQTRTNKSLAELDAEERERLLDEATQLLVVADEARKQGLDDNADIRGQIELQHLNLLAQTLIRGYIDKNPISDAQVQAAFDARNPDGQREYKARHILVEDEEKAISLIAQLDYGSDFAELAREHSTGPSAESGGDLGWFTAEQMVKPFSEAVAALDKGLYTKTPVQTRFGWHVILAEDNRPVAAPPPEQIRQEVGPALQKEAIESYIESLKAAASVEKIQSPGN